MSAADYTIPSDNRELQQTVRCYIWSIYYTIPSDNRELQQYNTSKVLILIIPYQVITGNYNRMMIQKKN